MIPILGIKQAGDGIRLALILLLALLLAAVALSGCAGSRQVQEGDARERAAERSIRELDAMDAQPDTGQVLIVLSQREALEAGIPKKTVRKIMERFDGDVTRAVDQWAFTLNTRLTEVAHARVLILPDSLPTYRPNSFK